MQHVGRRPDASGASFVKASDVRIEHLQVCDVAGAPLNFIFGCLFDQTNALEHIGDVVDASLRHAQYFNSLIQIDRKQRLRCLYDADEASG